MKTANYSNVQVTKTISVPSSALSVTSTKCDDDSVNYIEPSRIPLRVPNIEFTITVPPPLLNSESRIASRGCHPARQPFFTQTKILSPGISGKRKRKTENGPSGATGSPHGLTYTSIAIVLLKYLSLV
eukprot:g66076.t1